MAFHQALSEGAQWFWPSAINHLWQATLFTLLVWASMPAFRQASPRMRTAAWWLALVKFLLPMAWLAFVLDKLGLRFSRAESLVAGLSASALVLVDASEPVAKMNALAGQNAAHNEVYCILTLVWLVGSIAVWARWQTRRRRLAHLLRTEAMQATGPAAELFVELQKLLGFNRHIPLIISARVAEPCVWGVWCPKVVLPPGLDDRLSDDELAAVLAHELFHIGQRDNLLIAERMVVCGLFWFHPLVWLVDRKLTDECELMCDEKVIRYGSAAESYATGLWKVVQHGLGWPVTNVPRATGSNLKRRIELMLKTNYLPKPTLRQRALAGLTVTMLIALSFAFGLLRQSDVWAQNQRSNQVGDHPTGNRPAVNVVQGVSGGITGGMNSGIGQGIAGGVPGGVPGGVEAAPNLQSEKKVRQEGIQHRIKEEAVSTENASAWRRENDQQKNAKQEEGDKSVLPMSASLRPKILYKEDAQYTKEARDERVQGTVVLNMVFSADGKITNIKVIRGLPQGLTEAAIEATKKIRFEPAMKDGQPVSVRGNIEYSFRLAD